MSTLVTSFLVSACGGIRTPWAPKDSRFTVCSRPLRDYTGSLEVGLVGVEPTTIRLKAEGSAS